MPSAPYSPPSPHASDNNAHENVVGDHESVKTMTEGGRKAGLFSSRRILGPVEKDGGDWALLACCFVTGLVDAASFGNWAMFVGMQTGNTVILGLSTAGLPSNPHAWVTTLVSLASFLIGAFATFRVSKFVTPSGPHANRLWCSSLFIIQALFVLLAAALATHSSLIPQEIGGPSIASGILEDIRIVSLLPPLALQSGMQIASSRLLGYNELPVNVLTSTYCDLMGDFNLLAFNNVRRNRRAGAAVLLLLGAISSGWLMRSSGGLESVLWIAGGIKVIVGVVMFVSLREEKAKTKEVV